MEQGLNKVLPSERMSTNTIPHSSELGQTCPSGYQNPSAPVREIELAKRRAECLPGFVISLREAHPPASAALAQVWPGDCEVRSRIFGPYDGHDWTSALDRSISSFSAFLPGNSPSPSLPRPDSVLRHLRFFEALLERFELRPHLHGAYGA